jgi:hypothetical protein
MICNCCGEEHYDPSQTIGTDVQLELFPESLYAMKPLGPQDQLRALLDNASQLFGKQIAKKIAASSPWLELAKGGVV